MIGRIIGGCVLVALMAGCGGQKGESYIMYERGQQANTIPAPKTADYALYSGTNQTPKVVIKVNKGEKLGFEKGADGKVMAVAGEKYSTVIDPKAKESTWKMR
jgi:hypothetical protein